MPQGGKSTELTPGVIARVVQAARYALSGVTPDAWFGPMQPLTPMAPAGVAGRQFDYPVGYNLDSRPRSGDAVSFDQFRALADNCDILRSVIETRKDQMEAMDWTVRLKATDSKRPAATDAQKRQIAAIIAFLQSPDRTSNWAQRLRQLLEDRFVIDAAIYKRRDRKGRL